MRVTAVIAQILQARHIPFYPVELALIMMFS